MHLTIFNGSPKPGPNNTEILLQKFIEGFATVPGHQTEIIRMNSDQTYRQAAQHFRTAEVILLAFPLYVYSMPAGVKMFIEELAPLLGKCAGKKIAFLVQFGFHEATHARPLEAYLERLAHDLNCEYLGTIIRGGCDGLAKNSGSKSWQKKVLRGIYDLGKDFGMTQRLERLKLNEYAKPETQKATNKFIMRIMIKLMNKFYWEAKLKKNGVTTAQSFVKPYGV